MPEFLPFNFNYLERKSFKLCFQQFYLSFSRHRYPNRIHLKSFFFALVCSAQNSCWDVVLSADGAGRQRMRLAKHNFQSFSIVTKDGDPSWGHTIVMHKGLLHAIFRYDGSRQRYSYIQFLYHQISLYMFLKSFEFFQATLHSIVCIYRISYNIEKKTLWLEKY